MKNPPCSSLPLNISSYSSKSKVKMCDIQRLNKLKRQALIQAERIRNENPLSYFDFNHVTGSGFTYSDLVERLDRISSCASVIELKETWLKSETDNTMEQAFAVAAANYCKQPAICPICADRSQARRQIRFADPIREQARLTAETKRRIKNGEFVDNAKSNRYAYLITYTITDGEDLGERLDHLKESKRMFRLMGQRRRRGRSHGESGKIAAAISTIEIKRGKNSNQWHVHAHELAFTDKPLNYVVYDEEKRRTLCEKYGKNVPSELLKGAALNTVDFRGKQVPVSKASIEWLGATGGDSLGIRIDPIRHVPEHVPEKKKRRYRLMSFEESVLRQAREVLKYVTKPLDNSPRDAIEIIDKTYNRRLVATYGDFRGVGGSDYDDPPADDEQSYVLVWDKNQYGDPQPGKLREALEEQEAHKARSQCGILTGEYRRRRRILVSARSKYGASLAAALDDAKRSYRSQIRGVWSLYRQAVDAINAAKRYVPGGCDKYSGVSPALSLAGSWIPGTDRRALYAAAFS